MSLLALLAATLALAAAPVAVAAPTTFSGTGHAAVAVDDSCSLHQPPLTGAACEAFDPFDGDVYLGAPGSVSEFKPDGTLIRSFAISGGGGEPTLAVDQSGGPSNGDLYIAESTFVQKFTPSGEFLLAFGNGVLGGHAKPVNEVQTVTVGAGATGGVFRLGEIGSAFTATTASGSPNLTSVASVRATNDALIAGSNRVQLFGVGNHTFEVGQTIVGSGIPPGTTITGMPEGQTLVLSAAVTVTARDVGLSATAHGAGELTTGSDEVTAVANVGEFDVGQTITGAGIPAATTITAVDESEDKLILSAGAGASGLAVALTATVKPHLAVGESVSAPGIPAGATIASLAANGDPTLSAAATAFAGGVEVQTGVSFDASAAALRSLLEPSFGAGNVDVTGPAGGPFAIEFVGGLADTDVERLTSLSALTPSGAGVAVATAVRAASAFEICTAADAGLCLYTSREGVGGEPGAFTYTGRDRPIAVDASGHVWVGDENRLAEYGEAGEFISDRQLPRPGEVASLALDSDPSSPAYEDFYALVPVNEVQRVVPPSSGTYILGFVGSLKYSGGHTESIPASASASAVQTALDAFYTEVGISNPKGQDTTPTFRVEGPAGGPFTVEFIGVLGGHSNPGGFESSVFGLEASAGSVTTIQEGGWPRQIEKLGPSGNLLETLDPSGHPKALGLDPAGGDLFVSDQSKGHGEIGEGTATLLEYGPSGAQLEAFAAGEVLGAPVGNALAFGDAAKSLYVTSDSSLPQIFSLPEPGPLLEVGSTKATDVKKVSVALCAELNPEGAATTIHFDYITAAKFKEDGEKFGAGTLETGESSSIGADFEPQQACQTVNSLTTSTAYRFRVVAENEDSVSPVTGETASFETEPPATIDATYSTDVTATSALLHAEINPLGDSTAYRFEYLTEAEYTHNLEEALPPFAGAAAIPTPDGSLGAGEADVAVSQILQGLAPHTTYRYRVLAENAFAEGAGALVGPPRAFTTQTPGSASLPDQRAWELVSPPDKYGASLVALGEDGQVQAAASGDAMTYLATGPTELDPPGYSNFVQVLSTRGPSGGWQSRDIAAPHAIATSPSIGAGQEYRLFSADLSQAVLQPFGAFEPSLSSQATEQTPYMRTDFAPAEQSELCTSACYLPLLTAADVTSGKPFGDEGKCPPLIICGPRFVAGTPDLAHVVIESGVPLTSAPGDHGGAYEYSSGAPSAEALRFVGAGVVAGRDAISADGRRVVFYQQQGHIYLRLNATEEQSAVVGGNCTEPTKACSLQLDALQGGSGAGAGEEYPVLRAASSDESRIFFTDEQRLTPDSGATGGGGTGDYAKPDLYEYDLQAEVGHRLTDLTPINGEESGVVQSVLGASEDGSSVYFVADGVLAHNKVENGNGEEEAQAGQPNLYLHHAGVTRLIAVLSSAENHSAQIGVPRVSPNGRYLAFQSQRPLTGYDNRDAVSGKPDQEVFLYDAQAGRLHCASCNPTGARPHGVEYGKIESGLVGGFEIFESDQWIAAILPAVDSGGGLQETPTYQPSYLSDSGRLFFNSPDALVPADTNGTEDVYQYEPPKGGEEEPPNDTCTTESPTYGPASGGCVDLISSGTSAFESAFLGASENGDDVFFLTSAALSPRDTDTSLDVYDARVGGGETALPPLPACEGDACQSPVGAPEDLTPGSLTFQGPGNLLGEAKPPPSTTKRAVKCKRPKKLGHSKCVKAKSKKANAKKAKKASHDQGAKR